MQRFAHYVCELTPIIHHSPDEILGQPLESICTDPTWMQWAITQPESCVNTTLCNQRGEYTSLTITSTEFAPGAIMLTFETGFNNALQGSVESGDFQSVQGGVDNGGVDIGDVDQHDSIWQEDNTTPVAEWQDDPDGDGESTSMKEDIHSGGESTTIMSSSEYNGIFSSEFDTESFFDLERKECYYTTQYGRPITKELVTAMAAMMPMHTAAQHLCIEMSVLQRICHELGISQWPKQDLGEEDKRRRTSKPDETSELLQESVRVFPRRRQSYSEGMPAPYLQRSAVYVSRQSLDSLKGIPLREAALVLGISSTALKKACRKLGMDRWMYNSRSSSKKLK